MKLAVADVRAGVVGVAQRNGHNHQDVEQEGRGEKGPKPVLVRARSKELENRRQNFCSANPIHSQCNYDFFF